MTVMEWPATRGVDAATFHADVVTGCRPVVLRGLVADWPAVRAAAVSPESVMNYVAEFAVDRPLEAFYAAPQAEGRYFYEGERFGTFNFERRQVTIRQVLGDILAAAATNGGGVYLGSIGTRDALPGFADANASPCPPALAEPRIWIGTRSHVSTHHDNYDNLACVVAGRRRFTLYSPELIRDLYVGPIDRTMAGQPVSLAASAHDDARYPRFAAIRDRPLVVELEPGDALYLPKLWWHQVEGLARVNVLVNYWWDAFAAGPDAPYVTMMLAMIAIAERPAPERAAWRAFFDHYVFRPHGHPLDHLPPEEHGVLGPSGDGNYARIRAQVMQALRRS